MMKVYEPLHKVEEVRLTESRKSARLQQDNTELHHPQQQYAQSLMSSNVEIHAFSDVIDVPKLSSRNRYVTGKTVELWTHIMLK